jgi:putative hemolysin
MIEFLLVIVCLLINALLAGSEAAFIAVSRPYLKVLAKKGNEEAKLLLKLHENPERTLSVIQVGITFVGFLAAALGGAGADEFMAPKLTRFGIGEALAEFISIVAVVVPLTFVSVVIGELVPKTFALRRPLFLATKTAPWLLFFNRILNPIVTVFAWSTEKIVNLFPAKHVVQEEVSQTEIVAGVEILSPKNKQYVVNILKIENTRVDEIMIPWKDVVFAEIDQEIEKVEDLIISSGHTRLPVVKKEEVIGIINAKEFLAYQKSGKTDWLPLLRSALKITDSTPILSALQLMQENRAHLMIIYKGLSKVGIITMEAIFEEIIGDIYDEDDDGTLQRILESIRFK